MPTRTWFPLTPRTVMVTSSPIMTVSPTRRVRMSIFHILCRSSFRFAVATPARHQPPLFVCEAYFRGAYAETGTKENTNDASRAWLERLRHGPRNVLGPIRPQPPSQLRSRRRCRGPHEQVHAIR